MAQEGNKCGTFSSLAPYALINFLFFLHTHTLYMELPYQFYYVILLWKLLHNIHFVEDIKFNWLKFSPHPKKKNILLHLFFSHSQVYVWVFKILEGIFFYCILWQEWKKSIFFGCMYYVICNVDDDDECAYAFFFVCKRKRDFLYVFTLPRHRFDECAELLHNWQDFSMCVCCSCHYSCAENFVHFTILNALLLWCVSFFLCVYIKSFSTTTDVTMMQILSKKIF